MAVEDTERIIWILDLIVENKVGVETSTHQQSLLMLMEKGVLVNLLLRIEIFPDIEQQGCWYKLLLALSQFMGTDMQNTIIYERSINYKSKIFEKIPVIVDGALKLGDYRVVVALTINMFWRFLEAAGVDYCRSMIRSHVQDGTMRKMEKLLSDNSQEEWVFKLCSFEIYKKIFLGVIIADRNTLYNKPCNKIMNELRLSVPIFIKMLGRKEALEGDRSTTLRVLKIFQHYVIESICLACD